MSLVDGNVVGGKALATPALGAAYLRRGNPALAEAEVLAIVGAYWYVGPKVGVAADGAFAQACHETNFFKFGNQVAYGQHNPAGIGATNDGAAGLSFPDWLSGVAVHFAHLLAWCGAPGGEKSPRKALVDQVAKAKGYARTWRDLGGRWAVPGTGYGDAIERHWQGILSEGAKVSILTKPTVTSRPSPNHGYNGAAYKPEAIVWHISQGAGASAVNWLTNPASNASSNYVVMENGEIVELVNPEGGPNGAAWANGDVNKPDMGNALIAGWVKAGINPNLRTISIEHAGMTSNNKGGSLTAAQVAATARLTAWLCSRFGIAPDQDHVLGHYQINDVDRPYCPGFSAAEWTTYVNAVAALVASGGGANKKPIEVVKPAPAPMIEPVVIGPMDFGGKGRVVAVEVTVENTETGMHYARKWEGGGFGEWHIV